MQTESEKRESARASRRAWKERNPDKQREGQRAWKQRNREHVRAYQREWKANNPENVKAQSAAAWQKLRREVIEAYGGLCRCCGVSDLPFLTIDHVNVDGAAHRKLVGAGAPMYYDIRRRGFPAGFQVLCHNCNQGRYINGGICPHMA
jgi:hypothetical protein